MQKILAFAAIALIAVGARAATITPANDGFEDPSLGAGSGAYDVSGHPVSSYSGPPSVSDQGGAGWTFGSGSGIAANGSAFTTAGAANGNVSDGHTSASGQAALLQQTGATFSQTLTIPTTGTVSITFLSEGRNAQSGSNPFEVSLGGTLFTFASVPTGATLTGGTIITPTEGTTFQSYTSNAMPIVAGSYPLTFTGLGSGSSDVTSFIDSVSLTNVPEPATFTLAGGAALGLLLPRRRRIA